MSARLFFNRDEKDLNATRVLKFLGMLIASYGDDENENNNLSPVISSIFNELTTVSHMICS
jgi:hypothetical protein